MNFFKLMTSLAKGDKIWSDYTKEVQIAFLNGLREPHTDIERSHQQYKCQNFFRSKSKISMLNIGAAIAAPFVVFYCFLKRIQIKKGESIEAICDCKGFEEIVPDELQNEYKLDYDHWEGGFILDIPDLSVVGRLFLKYPLSPYFFLKSTLKMASYHYMIYKHQPKAICVHAEYSFSSSFLTMYCNMHGVEHINFMHGEKLYYIGYCYFRFNRCYVWNEYYKNLLIELKAEKNQFIISVPKSLRIDKDRYYEKNAYAKYKYYLQIFSEDELKKIIESLKFINDWEENLRFRPHPRFSDLKLLKKYVSDALIEYPREVSIMTSIASADVVIGYCSTVLFQGYLAKKTVVLDDIAYKEGNLQLKNHEYILSNMEEVNLLSELNKS